MIGKQFKVGKGLFWVTVLMNIAYHGGNIHGMKQRLKGSWGWTINPHNQLPIVRLHLLKVPQTSQQHHEQGTRIKTL